MVVARRRDVEGMGGKDPGGSGGPTAGAGLGAFCAERCAGADTHAVVIKETEPRHVRQW